MEQFFDWQARQTERYELVGGVPVRLMAGARNVHDDIVVNLLAELRRQLRGSGCRPFTGDGGIEALPGQIRRPDIGVDRGRRDANAARVAMWSRGADGGWTRALLEGLERSVDLPAIGVTLALAEIYDGVEFPAGPRLAREAR